MADRKAFRHRKYYVCKKDLNVNTLYGGFVIIAEDNVPFRAMKIYRSTTHIIPSDMGEELESRTGHFHYIKQKILDEHFAQINHKRRKK